MKPPGPRWRGSLFPLRYWNQVPPLAVQAALRAVFPQWGLPDRIRVDNGPPWGSSSDLPPALALWWIGLGIGVIWNRPYHAQANGFVERFHGLLDAWGEPAACADHQAWATQVAWVVATQRERYPAIAGRSRLAAFPALQVPRRAYTPAQEPAEWDLGRVYAHLAAERWPRWVNQSGQITLYRRVYSVGRAWAGRQVWVRFAPQDATWVIDSEDGRALARHPAGELTAERIRALAVSHVRASERRPLVRTTS